MQKIRLLLIYGVFFMKNIPIRTFKEIYHIGNMNIENKKEYSLEGQTLSVSMHPDEWGRIAQLESDTCYSISHGKGLNLVDVYQFMDNNKSDIIYWAVENELAEMKDTFSILMSDEDDSLMKMTFDNLEEAKKELDDEDEYVLSHSYKEAVELFENGEPVIFIEEQPVLTQDCIIKNRLQTSTNALDNLAVLYIEEHKTNQNIHGVWWNDRLDVLAYSAPRGGIFLDILPQLTSAIVNSPGEDIDENRIPKIQKSKEIIFNK